MYEIIVAAVVFACLLAASLGSLLIYQRLPAHHLQDDSQAVIRAVAGIFVVLTSLVLGLMINSAKNTFESVDRNVHAIATGIIILDRILQQVGPAADPARGRLLAYAKRAADASRPDRNVPDRTSETVLGEVGMQLRQVKTETPEQTAALRDATQQYLAIVQLRWVLVEQSEGTIPMPLVVLLVAWLVLIFASFGYRAPRNALVIGCFIASSALMAGAIYLILDMDVPFGGPIQVSRQPIERAIAEMQR